MMLSEWQSWWRDIPAFRALEKLDLHTVMVLADGNWKIDDRDIYLSGWRELAAHADAVTVVTDRPALDPADPAGIRKRVRAVFDWLRMRYVGAGARGDGIGEG
jgi:hypothetical protein